MALLKKLLLVGLVSTSSLVFAQENKYTENKIFNHLDIAVTAGSSGLGIELASPIGNMVQLRTGFSFIPEFRPKMNFGIEIGDDPAASQSKFEQMSSALEKLVGYEVNNSIDMIGDPNFYAHSRTTSIGTLLQVFIWVLPQLPTPTTLQRTCPHCWPLEYTTNSTTILQKKNTGTNPYTAMYSLTQVLEMA